MENKAYYLTCKQLTKLDDQWLLGWNQWKNMYLPMNIVFMHTF